MKPTFLHLDVVFTIVDEGLAIVYKDGFQNKGLLKLRGGSITYHRKNATKPIRTPDNILFFKTIPSFFIYILCDIKMGWMMPHMHY